MIELTREQAIQIAESEVWKNWSSEETVKFQLYQPKLCIPFGRFHAAVEKVLGRPVYTSEFGLNYDGLIAEFEGRKGKPTLQEIIDMLPLDKTVIVVSKE